MQLNKRNPLFIIGLLLLLAGCVPTPDIKPEKPVAPPAPDPRLTQVAALESSGNHLAAAELLETIAISRPPPEREQQLLQAAEIRFRANDSEGAANLLQRIDTTTQPQLDFRKRLLMAELLLQQSRADDVLDLLQQPPQAETRIDLRRRYHKIRAAAFGQSGNLLERGRELGELDLLITDQAAKLENQLEIIRTYATLSDEALALLQPSPPGIQGGWMELARIIKAYANDSQQIQLKFEEWRQRFPQHPAMPELLAGYYEELGVLYRRPAHIAVMLPESGRFARVAAAIRDGIIASYFTQDEAQRPRLAFYDSSNPEEIWPRYQEAIEAGAEMVIGPLSKAGVKQFTQAGELEIPVLTLNQVAPETTPPETLYQFGLTPEDEARQVAERAWSDGLTTALVLTPADAWGKRIHDAFLARWEQLGGVLAEYQQYDTKDNDFARPITALLNLDESIARNKTLQRLLGKRPEFEPRRRQDADFIFLAAKSAKAREIRPQLQFHHAADLPVYSTSHIFSGKISIDADRDLEGIRFPLMPWLIGVDQDDPLAVERLSRIYPDIPTRYLPLYAMGMDSFQLPDHLARLASNPREMMEGRTGNLYLDRLQLIHRQLVWAQMERGQPKILGFTPQQPRQDVAPTDQPPATPAIPAGDREVREQPAA